MASEADNATDAKAIDWKYWWCISEEL